MRSAVAIGCLFFSGAAALLYEVCWIRAASLVFGSTTWAVSTVLAVFFLGLAVGGELFGRIARATPRPLRLFALLELGVAALALVAPAGFALADLVYGHAYRAAGDAPALLTGVRVALVAAVLLPPTVLMGGTLPLFCRRFVAREGRLASTVGLLYAINTLGAAVGCAAAGLLLLPQLGASGTIALGVGLNLAVAALAGWLARGDELPAAEPRSGAPASPHTRGTAIVGLLFFAVGFVALGNEVLWTRYLGLLVRNTVHTYTLTLTVVLLGIVVGSALGGALADRTRSRAFAFGLLQVATGISVLFVMLLPPGFWQALGGNPAIYAVLLLPPAALSGASFPLAVRMLVTDPKLAGFGVGRLAALNTAGGVAGSLAVGFLLLPWLGLQGTLLVDTGLSLLLGCAAWALLDRERPAQLRVLAMGCAVLLWSALPLTSRTRLPADFLAAPERLVDHAEGRASNLAVVRDGDRLGLEIDRWWQGEARRNHQAVAAHIPMLLHPDPRRVLVVGAGAGQTPGRFLLYGIDHLDCVDIEPAVFEMIRRHFESAWMDDPRVRILRGDGRNHLIHSAEHWDLISLEVGQTFRPGVAFFYTEDFYRRARARLAPGGLLTQFVPLPFLDPETFRGVVNTFLRVFPTSVLWYNTSELLLVGSNGERFAIDADRLAQRLAEPRIHEDLRYAHWGGPDNRLHHPEVFLGGLLAGPAELRELAGAQAPVYRDDRPVLDHASAAATEAHADERPIVALLEQHRAHALELVALDGPGPSPAAIRERQRRNLADMEAMALVRIATAGLTTAPREQTLALLAEAVRLNPDSFAARLTSADLLMLEQRHREAEEHYEAAVRLADGDFRAHRGLASALLMLRRFGEASTHLRTALRLRSDDAEAHNALGAALGQLGYHAGAVRHFEEALRLEPGDEGARRNLAQARNHVRGSAIR